MADEIGTPANLFDRAGRALFGDLYVAPMAALLGVHKTWVRNWAAGKSMVPAGVWRELLDETERRDKTIGLLRHALRTMIPETEKAP